jgi:hypothetical protein
MLENLIGVLRRFTQGSKHKNWSSKQQLRAFTEFVEQLEWSPSQDDEVTEDGLAPHPHLPVMEGLQCQHCPIRFQLLESEAAYQHRRIHGSMVGCHGLEKDRTGWDEAEFKRTREVGDGGADG